MKLRCPECHCGIKKSWFKDIYKCKCGYMARNENGLYYLNANNETWEVCEKEKQGWVNISKELGIYVENDDHFYLPDGRPHLAEYYREAKRSIDKMLEIVNFNGKLCLDVGAGIGWVECYILKHVDAEFIALDCNDDPLVGLGRSDKVKQHHNVKFTSIVGDMHNIPLRDNSIDVVFTIDALHHFTNLESVLKEIHRVLKPNGVFLGVNEPWRGEHVDEKEYSMQVAPMENKHGIIERRPTVDEYKKAGRLLGLRPINEEVGLITPGLILKGIKY